MIVASMLICNDKVTLQSKHRHDFVDHTDENGTYYMLDGGLNYIRHAGTGQLVDVRDTDDILKIRNHMYWGQNYTKDKELLPETVWALLKDLEDDHLDGLIEYWENRLDKYENADKWLNIFKREKEFRDGL